MTTSGQSGPMSNGHEGILDTVQISRTVDAVLYRNLSHSFFFIPRVVSLVRWGYSRCILSSQVI